MSWAAATASAVAALASPVAPAADGAGPAAGAAVAAAPQGPSAGAVSLRVLAPVPARGLAAAAALAARAARSGAAGAPPGPPASALALRAAVSAFRAAAGAPAGQASVPRWPAERQARAPPARRSCPVRDAALSARCGGHFQTPSSPGTAAAEVPRSPDAESSPAARRRAEGAAAATLAPRCADGATGVGVAGGGGTSRKAPGVAARRSASCARAYRRRSRNTPCSPNRLAIHRKRRQGPRRPLSFAASHASTS